MHSLIIAAKALEHLTREAADALTDARNVSANSATTARGLVLVFSELSAATLYCVNLREWLPASLAHLVEVEAQPVGASHPIKYGVQLEGHEKLWSMLDGRAPSSVFQLWGFAQVVPMPEEVTKRGDGYIRFMVRTDADAMWFYAHTDRTSCYVSRDEAFPAPDGITAWHMMAHDQQLDSVARLTEELASMSKKCSATAQIVTTRLAAIKTGRAINAARVG